MPLIEVSAGSSPFTASTYSIFSAKGRLDWVVETGGVIGLRNGLPMRAISCTYDLDRKRRCTWARAKSGSCVATGVGRTHSAALAQRPDGPLERATIRFNEAVCGL